MVSHFNGRGLDSFFGIPEIVTVEAEHIRFKTIYFIRNNLTYRLLMTSYRNIFKNFLKQENPRHCIVFLGSNELTYEELNRTPLYYYVNKTFQLIKNTLQTITVSAMEPECLFIGTSLENDYKARRKNFINWLRRSRKKKRMDHVINATNNSVPAVAMQDSGSYYTDAISLSPEGIAAAGLILEGFYKSVLVKYQ